MVEITYQMVLSTLQTAGLLVGIFYYIMVLRNQQKSQKHAEDTRQAQLFMDIYKELLTGSEVMYLILDMEYDDFEDFERKYGRDNNPEANDMITKHMLLVEGVGVLVREGYVSVRLVALLTSGLVRIGWEKLRDYVYERRKRSFPRWSIEYEYLYNTLMEYAEKHPELQI